MTLSHTSTLPVTLLAVDTAKRSGYAILVPFIHSEGAMGTVLEHRVALWGSCRAAGIPDILRHFIIATKTTQASLPGKVQPVVLFEEPARRARFRRVASGLGEERGRWQTRLDDADLAKKYRLKVPPSEWRTAVYGQGYARPFRRMSDEARRAAMHLKAAQRIKAVWRQATATPLDEVDADGAEAILLGEYGTRAARVAELLTHTLRRSWT